MGHCYQLLFCTAIVARGRNRSLLFVSIELYFIADGQYVMQILRDYKSSTLDIFTDARDRPIKAAIYITGISVVGYCWSKNPDEKLFDEALLNASNDLLQVSDLVRNPDSNSHLQDLLEMRNKGFIRRMNLGVCSLMWRDNFGTDVSLFDSSCKHLKVTWKEFPNRILDVGFHGRWLYLEKAMQDYDVNYKEFE
ncbi:Mitochondrial import inner membrane translocase subunit Tim29 [Holothuria leucospilota]|uniref:Mitochondrial import inner membrane translocase subunit Tim29 n=1 Tax=Holothuria leucospilota TaxID=206669 RepID=A0A9Q1C8Y4_HOLLE|nr:Mitochondrial import inner membrane translocase subunit Tim29 [Holothuria leucospilota]